MSRISVTAVCKGFGEVAVLRGVDLDVGAGELTAILGPSGCGKTTLLRLIAGFDVPDSGTIDVGKLRVCDERTALPPERRGVSYVAQEGALFPHLTVAGNITFGLPRAARRAGRRVEELLELVGMGAEYTRRYPHQLSGGQQQRVALARALAPQPSAVLLDEPFASLDAGLRTETRRAVLAALAASGATTLLVTHDQSEALSVASRVALMWEGRLVQVAAPAEIYSNPSNPAVARFLGEVVQLPGVVSDGVADCALGRIAVRNDGLAGPADLLIRPEQLLIQTRAGSGVPALVEGCTYYGHDAIVALRLDDSGTLVTARCPGHAMPRTGAEVSLTVDGEALAFPRSPVGADHPLAAVRLLSSELDRTNAPR